MIHVGFESLLHVLCLSGCKNVLVPLRNRPMVLIENLADAKDIIYEVHLQ